MTDPHDDLYALLTPPEDEDTSGLRDAVLRATERRLALARRLRFAARAAGVAAVFLAGAGLDRWVAPRPPGGAAPEFVKVPEVQAVVIPVPVVVMPEPPSQPPPRPEPRTARALELGAEQADGAPAAALYRQAGDAYLAEQDYANAARCYRLFLARGGDEVLSLEPGDSWLLTSLKNAAFKEKVNAIPTDS